MDPDPTLIDAVGTAAIGAVAAVSTVTTAALLTAL